MKVKFLSLKLNDVTIDLRKKPYFSEIPGYNIVRDIELDYQIDSDVCTKTLSITNVPNQEHLSIPGNKYEYMGITIIDNGEKDYVDLDAFEKRTGINIRKIVQCGNRMTSHLLQICLMLIIAYHQYDETVYNLSSAQIVDKEFLYTAISFLLGGCSEFDTIKVEMEKIEAIPCDNVIKHATEYIGIYNILGESYSLLVNNILETFAIDCDDNIYKLQFKLDGVEINAETNVRLTTDIDSDYMSISTKYNVIKQSREPFLLWLKSIIKFGYLS